VAAKARLNVDFEMNEVSNDCNLKGFKMRKLMVLSVVLLGISCLQVGCNLTVSPGAYDKSSEAKVAASSQSEAASEQGSEQTKKRFELESAESADQNEGAVEWAQRFEELSVKNNSLREKNNELLLENAELQEQTDQLERELKQAKKDLAEANEFLQQMHVELNEWKSDVLGFRDEMRQAQKAQLEALGKILRVLGAEPVMASDNETNDSLMPKESK
jgi:chromosome segregation ATPase